MDGNNINTPGPEPEFHSANQTIDSTAATNDTSDVSLVEPVSKKVKFDKEQDDNNNLSVRNELRKEATPHHHHHPVSHVPHHHHHHYRQGQIVEATPHIHVGNHMHILLTPFRRGEEERKDGKGDKEENIETINQADSVKKEPIEQTTDNIEELQTMEKSQSPQIIESLSNGKHKSKTLTKTNIQAILSEYFPNRHHLGSLVYNPTTTWLTLQTSQLTGLKDEHFTKFEELRENYREKLKDEYYANSVKYIPIIPPLPADYINYLLEVKIPYRFIKSFLYNLNNGTIAKTRELWGGIDGIYSDDSDVLTVAAHLGFFDDTIDLTTWNPNWTPSDIITPFITKDEEIKGDLSITVLMLPGLKTYDLIYQNGINSRSWKEINKHDGLSLAIYNIEWELEGNYLKDKSFFKRYQTELAYDLRYMNSTSQQQDGWKFDMKLYKELKKKVSARID